MGLDVFSPLEGYRQDSMGAADPATEITPDGLFSNLGSAVGKGVTGGLAAVGRTVSDFAMQAGKQEMMQGMLMNPQVTAEQIQELDNLKPVAPYDDQLKAVQQWSRLDPRTTGTGSMVLGQTARGLTIFGMGSLMGGVPGGAATLGVTEGYNNYLDLKDAGVDDKTAGEAAATTGAMAALGAYLPVKMTGALARGALGAAMSAEAAGAGTAAKSLYTVAGLSAAASSSIVGNAAYSSLVNTGFGVASRALTSSVLEAGGYHDMARQYKPLDGEAIAADAILGLAFGGWAHVEGNVARRATPDARPPEPMVESAFDVRREEQINRGAVGIPSDPVTGALDRELQDRSVAEVLQGKTPEITPEEASQLLGEGPIPVTDEFRGVIAGVHGSDQPLTDIKPASEIPNETRYDGNGGVWGDGFYSAEQGDYNWFRGGDIRMPDFNRATVVNNTFEKAAVLTPDTVVGLLKKLGVKEVDTPEELAQILRGKGYDGAIVRGFGESEIDAAVSKLENEKIVSKSFGNRGGNSMLMNQVVHFKPESGVRILGKDATVGPLVERRKALNQELDAKAKAAGFYNANEPRLIVDGVDKYAPGGREFVDEITSSQNHAYALEKAGDSYAKAKAFEESAAVLRAKIESLRAETVALGSRKFEPPHLFNKPSNGVLVDPEKVRLAQDIESAAKVAHGDLADPTPPVIRPETAAREPIEAPPSMERPAGEQTGPAFEPSTQATIDQLAARHPDMDIELPDGSTVKASELPQKMQQMMAQAESDSKLHDVAVACFLRTV